MERKDLRNIAIIAHVDHGKTTLVDEMLKQSGVFRDNQVVADRVMDSGDIERERGITILSKNASTVYNGVKINIVDTPGHADFGGEVERVLKMVNGVLLLVDAAEGPMPQTRFVLQRRWTRTVHRHRGQQDRPAGRPDQGGHRRDPAAADGHGRHRRAAGLPDVFCSGRAGTASYSPDVQGTDLKPLFDTILEYVKPPVGDPAAPLQCLVSCIDYNEFVGRTAIGRIDAGTMKVGQNVTVCDWHNPDLHKSARSPRCTPLTGWAARRSSRPRPATS